MYPTTILQLLVPLSAVIASAHAYAAPYPDVHQGFGRYDDPNYEENHYQRTKIVDYAEHANADDAGPEYRENHGRRNQYHEGKWPKYDEVDQRGRREYRERKFHPHRMPPSIELVIKTQPCTTAVTTAPTVMNPLMAAAQLGTMPTVGNPITPPVTVMRNPLTGAPRVVTAPTVANPITPPVTVMMNPLTGAPQIATAAAPTMIRPAVNPAMVTAMTGVPVNAAMTAATMANMPKQAFMECYRQAIMQVRPSVAKWKCGKKMLDVEMGMEAMGISM